MPRTLANTLMLMSQSNAQTIGFEFTSEETGIQLASDD